MSSKPEPAIWSRDTGQRISLYDSCQLNIMWIKKTIKASANSNTNPLSGQYLTHAHSHISRAVAAIDSCFGLFRPHQHGIVVGQQ